MGADRSFDPSIGPAELLRRSDMDEGKADLVFEVSGNAQAIDFALSVAGFDARVVLGSWRAGILRYEPKRFLRFTALPT